MTRAESLAFWWDHLRVPLAAFVVVASVLAFTQIDLTIAHALFFDPSGGWIGRHNWWTNQFLHTGGRWAIRLVAAAALVLLAFTWRKPELRVLRRPTAYVVVAMVLSIGIVGLLKTLTNVDCPWDLTEFGGRFPHVDLFADRPDDLRTAQCFPAAHASSGYALLALYFAFRERHARLARIGLCLGIAIGLLFGVAQQARGAHFASHDVWSAFLVWLISLSVYAFAFRARLWNPVEQDTAAFSFEATSPAAGVRAVDGTAAGEPRAGGVRGTPRQ